MRKIIWIVQDGSRHWQSFRFRGGLLRQYNEGKKMKYQIVCREDEGITYVFIEETGSRVGEGWVQRKITELKR